MSNEPIDQVKETFDKVQAFINDPAVAPYVRPPVTTSHLYRGTLDNGDQVLVTIWSDGTAEIATRAYEYHTWSPPTALEEWQT